jgi:cytoskeleton protein RodZ
VEPLNYDNEGMETGEEVSLGRLLKKSREERQIELDEVFKVTRIQRHTLEALENELWDELPSQVFVKGFLRTYAKLLGLDTERVLELYDRILPPEGRKLGVVNQVSPRKKGWILKVILPLVALALIVTIIFFRREDISVVDKGSQYLEVQEPVKEVRETAVQEEIEDQAEEDKLETLINQESVEERDLTEVAPVVEKREEEPLTPQPDLTEAAPVVEKSPEEPLTPQFELTAHVRSRTWISIHVDDQPVKEYLFQPGETFTWKAHKGFDILVGNAGGINFMLNGAEIGRLGAEGKVMRLKLPKTED